MTVIDLVMTISFKLMLMKKLTMWKNNLVCLQIDISFPLNVGWNQLQTIWNVYFSIQDVQKMWGCVKTIVRWKSAILLFFLKASQTAGDT